jgi:phage tail sheath protein FI
LEPNDRTGLYTFKNVDEINIAAIPGITSKVLQGKLIIHCDTIMKDRFAVLDSEYGANLDLIKSQRNLYDTSFAALYYPWVYAPDALTGGYINVPPSGHVCGIYARTDVTRGVHKAPANEKINGVFQLERLNGKFRIVNKGTQDILNPLGINCIRQFSGRGIRVWGARTVTSNSLWKYVNVRRLFLFLEESIEKGTQWVVFEPNDEKLWARVKQTITQFLTGVWKTGALMGTTPEEAFFVKCDRSTMTQDDIDNGRLICIIGVAPVKPAEFVIFRIAQWQGGSAVTE